MKSKHSKNLLDEEIPSDEEDLNQAADQADSASDEYDSETAEDKRLRLAKEYLKRLQNEGNKLAIYANMAIALSFELIYRSIILIYCDLVRI